QLKLLDIHTRLPVLDRRRSLADGHSVLVEAMQPGGIGRQPHAIAALEMDLADGAHRQQSQRAGIDIEEGVAAEMLGDRHRARPALTATLTRARDAQWLGPDADGGGAVW